MCVALSPFCHVNNAVTVSCGSWLLGVSIPRALDRKPDVLDSLFETSSHSTPCFIVLEKLKIKNPMPFISQQRYCSYMAKCVLTAQSRSRIGEVAHRDSLSE